MTTFVYCRGCGQQIHETAPTCPKCGAPQGIQTASAATASAAVGAASPSAYSQVKWFRRRWFTILCLLTVAPIAGLIALTGPIYYSAGGIVKMLPKSPKTGLYIASVWWFVCLLAGPGSTTSTWFLLAVVIMSLLLGLRNNWPEK